ncbi:hypothetical protein OS493_031241 [Desmophyllum pertusum]|uniref:Uncharacterized protein n=1 Tax=Desmophyllum pertusum TaxID=174260 RepID=A0A9W9Z9K9_9CNID|nr:hypothetical protein OS493_031241 [Desmophyllum pertusum]
MEELLSALSKLNNAPTATPSAPTVASYGTPTTAAPKTVSILVPTPVPGPAKDKRRTISPTPSQLRQLRQRIAEVFHKLRVHPCTDGNKLQRICCTEIPLPNAAMNSTVVPQSLSVPNDVETRFSKADDKKTSRSNDKEIIAFVDTQNRGYIVPQSLSVPDDEKTRSVYNTSKTFSKAEDDRIFKAHNEEVIAFVDTQNRENIAVKIDVYPAQDKLNKDIQNEDFVEVQTDKVNEFDGTKSRSSTDTARRINITEDETNLIFKQSPYFDPQIAKCRNQSAVGAREDIPEELRLAITVHQPNMSVSIFTSRPPSALILVCGYLRAYLQPHVTCPYCPQPHSSPQICFTEDNMTTLEQETLRDNNSSATDMWTACLGQLSELHQEALKQALEVES